MWRAPPLGILYKGGSFRIIICQSSKKIDTEVAPNATVFFINNEYAEKGKWHDFVINVKWSYKKDGYLNVWIDNNRIVRYRGPTEYNDKLGPWFKMGIYRSPTPSTYVIYHDEYRRGFSPNDIGIENPLSISKLIYDLDKNDPKSRLYAIQDLAECNVINNEILEALEKVVQEDNDYRVRTEAIRDIIKSCV